MKCNRLFKGGWTDKRFIMTISVLVFFIFLSTGLVMLLFRSTLDPMYLSLLNMAKDPLMIIIGSVFALEGVEAVTNRKTKTEIDAIVERHVENADVGREVSENVYGSIEMEDYNMELINNSSQSLKEYNTSTPDDSKEDTGEYLV